MGITVAVVGLRFGAAFVPIYRSHPAVDDVILVDPDVARRQAVARAFGLAEGYASLVDALADPMSTPFICSRRSAFTRR